MTLLSQTTSTAERENLSDKIYSHIVDAISQGEFHEKSRLPTEAELAERFGVSRPTVREALFRLRSDGIITSRRGSGSFVAKRPSPQPMQFGPIESIADIDRYYSFRLCVESGAAALAADKHTPEQLDSIIQALQALTQAHRLGLSGIEEDVAFHMAIADASHNPFFISTIEFIVRPIRQCMELSSNLAASKSQERHEQVRGEHQAIVDAIAGRRPEQAAQAMHIHIDASRRRMFEGN